MKRLILYICILLSVSVALYSCNASRTAKGAGIGAGAGAVIGGVIGKATGNTAAGVIIGAAVGGAAGAGIGRYMDKQAAELQRDMKGATVERVGEGIKITFDSGILYDVNSDKLRPASLTNINSLSNTLKKYEDTNILIQGHTDNTGTREHNMGLSERRAESVSRQIKANGVAPGRITTQGMGPDQPVASNDTEAGRQQNRRVEVAIFANEKLKKAAERGDI